MTSREGHTTHNERQYEIREQEVDLLDIELNSKPYQKSMILEEDSVGKLTLLQVHDCKPGVISRSLVSFA